MKTMGVLRADEATLNGVVYPAEELRRIADTNPDRYEFDDSSGELLFKMKNTDIICRICGRIFESGPELEDLETYSGLCPRCIKQMCDNSEQGLTLDV